MNPFEILEISPGASPEDIKAAYHRLAKQWHPDRFSGAQKAQAEDRFRQLAEAFNMLKDSGRRTEAAQAAAAPQAPTPKPEGPAAAVPPAARTADDWFAEAKASFEGNDFERALGLIQYALRMETSKVEYYMLLAKVLDATQGDLRTRVKAYENVHKMAPKDPDTIVRLAELYEAVGMEARSKRMWDLAKQVAPGHRAVKARRPAGSPAKPAPGVPGAGAQGESLMEQAKALFARLTKRG
jgi:curved DNA-binding protein CbpA